jgi:hypothetical protein
MREIRRPALFLIAVLITFGLAAAGWAALAMKAFA